MFSPKADGRLQVQIPGPTADRPSWSKVGVIAALGFLIGIAWPRIAGVRLGPSVPADALSAAASASAAPEGPGGGAPSSAPASAIAPASAGSPAPASAAALTTSAGTGGVGAGAGAAAATAVVGHGFVFACKTSDGDSLKGSDCGSLPGLDGVVMPKLRKLAECPEAASANGKLRLVVHPDFGRGALSADLGRGQTLSSADALLACARTSLSGASLSGVTHENPRYSVSYTVTFEPPGGGTAGARAPAGATTGESSAAGDDSTAQVVWEVAIIRDAPKTGKVVARLQRGAAVHLGGMKDGWYPVKYGDGFANDGFVYRGAIGH